MSKKFFEGWYFKHQNKNETLSIIPGICHDKAFIQIITDGNSYNIDFSKNHFKKVKNIIIGNNTFSFDGIKLDISTPDLVTKGEIKYNNLTPLKSDIMGPFRFFPMQCRHGILSMHHELDGKLEINGKIFDFNNGMGYIEKDSGYSFPKRYLWVQSNDFEEKCSITAAVADIPFFGFHFEGIICAIYYKGKEYRLATYNSAKLLECADGKIKIANKKFTLEISVSKNNGHSLYSPIQGEMKGMIKESPSCKAVFKFFENNNLIFDLESPKTSCEFVWY